MYVGITINLENRLKEHNTGKNKSTKAYVPWHIIHEEEYPTRVDARKREKYLKSAAGRRRRWRKEHLTRPRGATEYPPVPN